jgi:hypothetical protein
MIDGAPEIIFGAPFFIAPPHLVSPKGATDNSQGREPLENAIYE